MRTAIIIIMALMLATTVYAANSSVKTISTVSGSNNSGFQPKFASRGPIGVDLDNTKATTTPFQYKLSSPYAKPKVATPKAIVAPARFSIKSKASLGYNNTKVYDKQRTLNYVAGVKRLDKAPVMPPVGTEVCCDTKVLKYYIAYQKAKCVPTLLDLSGFNRACIGVRGAFITPPNCQGGQAVCAVPKKFAAQTRA